MKWRYAQHTDADLLGRMNAELIQDEGHSNTMTISQLVHRMQTWLSSDYSAVIFEDAGEPLAYILFRSREEGGVLLRQFFVVRHRRREGIGRRAIEVLARDILPPGTLITLEVLVTNSRAISFWHAVGHREAPIYRGSAHRTARHYSPPSRRAQAAM